MGTKRDLVIHTVVTFFVVTVIAGCGPTSTTRPEDSTTASGSIQPGDIPTATITQPGKVLVDHAARRKELKSGSDKLCWASKWNVPQSALSPVVDVRSTDMGLDDRYWMPGRQMRLLGATCLKLEGAPCQTIVDTMLAWAKANAAINRRGKQSEVHHTRGYAR